MSSIDNRATNHFVKVKIRQVQFFTNYSNLNAVNTLDNTCYMVSYIQNTYYNNTVMLDSQTPCFTVNSQL